MNKTVNINLGGMFFHIDEDAYQKLSRYFDAIKRSLKNSSGQDEVIKDIEMRIAELLNEKQKSEKHVVGLKDVDEVIAIMGQPEDYIIEDEPKNFENQYQFNPSTKSKKLYRDSEKGMIGGVAAGLSHYFGIDIVWIRVILVLFVFFGFGTGIFAYIILWIVTPEAQTTSEKLEMTGEAVNISNIEKKVREEFENVSEKIKNVDYDKYGNQIKKSANKAGNSLGNFIISVFKIIAKFLGILLIITGLTTLVFLLIGVFTLGTNTFIDFPWQGFIETGNFTDYPIWAFGLLMFFAVGIPFFFLTLLGFKLLAPNTKSIGPIAKYTLLALWIISIALVTFLGIKQASAFAMDGRAVKKETLNIPVKDTLLIKFIHNDYFSKDIHDRSEFKITTDSTNNDIIYSNEVRFRIKKSNENYSYIQIEKEAKGKSFSEARQKAEQIRYEYKIIGSQLVFDNYLLTDLKNKFRNQEVEITLFLTEGTLFKVDDSVRDYDRSDDDFFNLDYDINQPLYKVGYSETFCLNCSDDYTETPVQNAPVGDPSVTNNKAGITTANDSVNSLSKLKVDKDGIIIKTN
ncbi:PspC domain-containing protein [Flavobacterium undicola]|uniref:PspC domain-containing protein n=1 Tax=Flavobacterium undicola TaxID=1932779 RepID=UPI0013780E7E|nr:PspC domain-containing protein [Flavobacterium undicola]MBA0883907.1 PspC domain-containing protein [Flavobacterium undicola]